MSNHIDPYHQPIYLDEQALSERWMKEDIRVASVLATMESVESWALSGQKEVEEAFKRLSNSIETKAKQKAIGSSCQDFLLVLAYAKTSRAMHILSCLDHRFSGAGLKLVQSAVMLANREEFECPEGKLMVERLDILRRIRQLSRVFSRQRLRFVIKALQEVKNEDE